jgi:hypothetical protein
VAAVAHVPVAAVAAVARVPAAVAAVARVPAAVAAERAAVAAAVAVDNGSART